VAEQRGIGSVYGSQPQPDSPDPHRITHHRVLAMRGETPADGTVDNRALWAVDAETPR
jgi:hypothetical protein